MRTQKRQEAELRALQERFPIGAEVKLRREFNRMPKGTCGVVKGYGANVGYPFFAWLEVEWQAVDTMTLEEAGGCLEP